jgi:hypothetical protein
MTHPANSDSTSSYSVFNGHRRIASGALADAALAVKHALKQQPADSILIFDDASGRTIDIDTRGSDKEIVARFAPARSTQNTQQSASPNAAVIDTGAGQEARGRGRPKLGVVAREVTLLPRHWQWLASQPGGASVALRKLVEDARRGAGDKDKQRRQQERAYHFMSALAGDLPGFEEATRALFANNRARFSELIAAWPVDISEHADRLAFTADDTFTHNSPVTN